MNGPISLLLAVALHWMLLTSHLAMAQSGRSETTLVLFGTDRAAVVKNERLQYGSERGRTLSVGRASVTLPRPGNQRQVASRGTELLTIDQFRQALKDAVARPRQNKGQVLVFVHGYNTTFESALNQAAEFSTKLPFDGPIILYSWPSSSRVDYSYDRESSEHSHIYLQSLLTLVIHEVGAANINIIAHGMGANPLLIALRSIVPSFSHGTGMGQLLFVLPDSDRDGFSNSVERIKPFVRGITLYVAADSGLKNMRRFWGAAPRAGEVSHGDPIILPGVDTIDTTGASVGRGTQPTVAQDMGRVLKGAGPPDSRLAILERVATPAGDYWRFPESGRATNDGAYAAMPVFFGTDRKPDAHSKLVTFTADRGKQLALGRALVTIPKAHKIASGPERPSWLDVFAGRNPFREDPNKHFTIYEISVLTKDHFVAAARLRLDKSNVFRSHALVFVHGYNVSFHNALFRTAQFCYDLGFDGTPFLYSWPSGGSLKDYLYDRDSAELSVEYLLEFLKIVINESGAAHIHLIAHSLGNDPLLKALQALAQDNQKYPAINQIVLAAPDIDKDRFEKLAAVITNVGRNRTLYASANDAALIAARTATRDIARAGDVPTAGPVIVSGVDTIDASSTSTAVFSLNHSSYAESRELLNDIKPLLQKGLRPKDRTSILEVVSVKDALYWRFPR